MPLLNRLCLIVCLLFILPVAYADRCCGNSCCGGMGGIRYCDSSAGRFVCNNGDYSACYCSRHAVMDLNFMPGCCLWQGGVMATGETGSVVCNDGTISEVCSIQTQTPAISTCW